MPTVPRRGCKLLACHNDGIRATSSSPSQLKWLKRSNGAYPADACLPIWDWVGGRYSLWSAAGLTIPLTLGWSAFEGLLGGAKTLDQHTLESPPADNLPMMMALLEFWQSRFLQCQYACSTALCAEAAALNGLLAATHNGE